MRSARDPSADILYIILKRRENRLKIASDHAETLIEDKKRYYFGGKNNEEKTFLKFDRRYSRSLYVRWLLCRLLRHEQDR